jgi:hypothetical protein
MVVTRLLRLPGGDNESVHSYQSAATSNSGYSYSGGSGDGGDQSTGAPQGEISRVIADAISGLPQSIDSVKGSLQGSLQVSRYMVVTLSLHGRYVVVTWSLHGPCKARCR